MSRLIVVQSDPRLAEAVRFGFEREGAQVALLPGAEAVGTALREARSAGQALPELVVAGAATGEDAVAFLDTLRQVMDTAGARMPILYLGNGIERSAALSAGASELLPAPAFVRDVVTLGRLLAAGPGRSSRQRGIEGQLSDYGGVFYMIRAMAAVRRSAVLNLVRGLRRGELRFYEGEVTSAQVGTLHGLAALHQLLLWTRAHFELHDENVVRRRQIPMSRDEIVADAERFLGEIRAVVGTLLPAAVYEPDPVAVARRKHSIPQPVHRVLRLFDGHRTMADVIEDSPYRVLETLRVANRLADLNLLRRQETPRGHETSIERWLSDQYAETTSAPIGSVELEPVVVVPGARKPMDARSRLEFARADTAPLETATATPVSEASESESEESGEDEWSDVLPTEMSSGFSPVVPAAAVAGEIVSPAGPPITSPGAAQETSADEAENPAAAEPPAAARTDASAALGSGKAMDRVQATKQVNASGTEQPEAQAPDEQDRASQPEESPGRGRAGEARAATAPGSGAGKRTGKARAGTGSGAAGRHHQGRAGEFTDDEHAFFEAGSQLASAPVPPAETFEDLDAGHSPPSFWQRLFGRSRAARPGARPGTEGKPRRR